MAVGAAGRGGREGGIWGNIEAGGHVGIKGDIGILKKYLKKSKARKRPARRSGGTWVYVGWLYPEEIRVKIERP